MLCTITEDINMKSSKENRTGSTVFVDVIAREKREYCVLVKIG